ncbi:DUF58 domain-containing protein [Leptolyngbya sp. FACHB-261]|uniref:DUF58 domain-containing protein n=1 Tax=Leptolyngbya sp. FACHB-261 TaxID=2692806 RepID=UPI001686F1FD|nr:DUF58 domain-containing protein [Leptolyngbya sp. FACHB-261]MBD2104816.1 DUF58 domain-containing protein [Leptolyngbya sp. FACHB-261]
MAKPRPRPVNRSWTTAVGRGVLLVGLLACALLIANRNATILALLIGAVAFWLTGTLFDRQTFSPSHLSRNAPSWVIEGGTLTVALDLRLNRPLAGALLEEIFPNQWINLRFLKAGNHLLHYSLTAPRRGFYSAESLRLRQRDRLGLREHQTELPVGAKVLVLPRTEVLDHWSTLSWLNLGQGLYSDPFAIGAGEEFYRVREYRPGDPLRSIDWKATARSRSPIVREFSRTRADSGMTLLLHLGTQALCAGRQSETNVEAAIRAAATLGRHCLENQQRLRLVSASRAVDQAGLRWQSDCWEGSLAVEPFLSRLAFLEPGSQMVSLDQAPLAADDGQMAGPIVWIDAAPNHLSLEVLLEASGRGQPLAAILVDWASFWALEFSAEAGSLTLLNPEAAEGEPRFTRIVHELSACLPGLPQVKATQLVQQVYCQGQAALSLLPGQKPERLSQSLNQRGLRAVLDPELAGPDFPALRQVGVPLVVLRPEQSFAQALTNARL